MDGFGKYSQTLGVIKSPSNYLDSLVLILSVWEVSRIIWVTCTFYIANVSNRLVSREEKQTLIIKKQNDIETKFLP